METGYKVEQVMNKKVLTTQSTSSITDCAKKMAEQRIGSIVIKDNENLVGIVTEQDLARKVLAKEIEAKNTPISQIMSKDVKSVTPTMDIYDAIVEMGKNKIKHLPVIDNNQLVGIISFKDIIRIQPDLIDLTSFKSSLNKEEAKAIFP